MASKTTILMLGAALVVAGCAKKRPEVLPPAPGETAPPAGTGTGINDGSVGTGVVPGSAEDFRRSVQSDTVNFALDSYDIDPTARAILDGQATWLAQYPNVRVTIEGHADERGTREYNLALGDRRANSAKNYLAARGVDAGRITTISYGKERPLGGSGEAAWAADRRAVTVVIN
ncbi:peptidoglycan-associated lipoprotein Pal [Sphingomonas baiyangensis]|uniref:Peptidoglycan-associated lipoprotein n=1 Tax=Sphingomonas baiyangensis TaxID=2572576 RepID=A0A4U1L4I6_9SPHN|nr:peptidoglycan-associated lipoprotein Pal [Sphingomonas baiyangensis]TKD51692.1 peptidoglycan-associated lipoprotein Pal [Sphingomonas baiyangensis]